MKILLFFPIAIALLILLDSCNNCPEDWQLEYEFLITFEIYDEITGEDLLQISSVYKQDSTRIFDEQGNVMYPGPVPGNGLVVFSPLLPSEEFELGQATEQVFYLHLYHIATKTTDIDTFNLAYSVYMDDECDEKAFSYLTLYYNGELVFDKTNWSRNLNVDLYK